MFIPASSEFVALCQAQVAVLTQGLGAANGAVYLTEELVEQGEAKLIPVVVYPEATVVWEEDNPIVLPELQGKIDPIPRLTRALPRLLPQAWDSNREANSTSQDWEENLLRRQRQIVLPLMHEGVVMGLLVTGREDRFWNEREKAAIERIARTIVIAYIMDQRRVWFEQQLTQTRLFQSRQRDRLDDLLHQFRNPLTAVRTLGKLILKRLLPGDKNNEAASGIVRESDRLQELLQQFDASLEMNEDTTPLTLRTALITEASQQPAANALLPGNVFTLESFSVADVLEALIVSAEAIAQERHLKFQSRIPTDLPLVRGNAKALREVLSNLIDNALKYTPADELVTINVGERRQTPQGEKLGVVISDTGPGIPSQDLEHLFERHYRGIQASTTIPGSGLGLAIAKELIEQMQGDIEVFSPTQSVESKQNSESTTDKFHDNLHRGTTFVVWLLIEQPKHK